METIAETIIMALLALLSNKGFYALMIASIIARAAITIVREANLSRKYKSRVVANLRENKRISTSQAKVAKESEDLKKRLAKIEVLVDKYKLDHEFRKI